MNDAKVSAGSPGELTPPGGPPGVPPAEGGAESSPEPFTICVRALSGEATTLKEAVRQCAAEAEARRQAGAKDEARRRAEIARDVAQLGPAQLKAKYDTEEDREALTMSKAKVSAGSPGELTPPGGPPGAPTAEGGAESAPEAYTICVRALSGDATTLEVDGADTIATVKEKFDTALLESDQEPMKGLSLWHENARLDESRTLQSYGIGAGAAIQALATEHDVEVELREEVRGRGAGAGRGRALLRVEGELR